MDLEKIFEILIEQEKLPQSILIESRDIESAYNSAIFLASKILNQKGLLEEHPDIFLIKPENVIKISEIKALQDFCYLTPQTGDKKVVIIHEANKFTNEAANSILKILEEPVQKRFFILTVKNKNQLLPTILSRCQCFNKRPEKDELQLIKDCISIEIFEKATKFFKGIFYQNSAFYDILKEIELYYEQFNNIEEFLNFLILINNSLIEQEKEEFIKFRVNLINYFFELFNLIRVNINYKNILTLVAIYLKKKNFIKGEGKIE